MAEEIQRARIRSLDGIRARFLLLAKTKRRSLSLQDIPCNTAQIGPESTKLHQSNE